MVGYCSVEGRGSSAQDGRWWCRQTGMRILLEASNQACQALARRRFLVAGSHLITFTSHLVLACPPSHRSVLSAACSSCSSCSSFSPPRGSLGSPDRSGVSAWTTFDNTLWLSTTIYFVSALMYTPSKRSWWGYCTLIGDGKEGGDEKTKKKRHTVDSTLSSVSSNCRQATMYAWPQAMPKY